MDLGAFGTVDMLGDVVVWANAVGVEAPQERLDGCNFVLYPFAGVECEFDVGFVEEETAEDGDGEKWDDDFERGETRPWAYRQTRQGRLVGRAATW